MKYSILELLAKHNCYVNLVIDSTLTKTGYLSEEDGVYSVNCAIFSITFTEKAVGEINLTVNDVPSATIRLNINNQ